MRVVDVPMVVWVWGWQDGWMVRRSEWRWRRWTGRGGVGCVPVGGGGGGGLHLGRGPRKRRPPADRRRQTRNGNEHWQILICHSSLQNAGETAPEMHFWAKPAPIGRGAKRNLIFLSEDGHVSTSSPGRVQQKFTAHTIPQQPNATNPHIFKAPIISLNSYTIIASKCFVFVIRCSVSPPSLVFSQLNL